MHTGKKKMTHGRGKAEASTSDRQPANAEPHLTEQNAQTIREEIDLSVESDTPPRGGSTPPSYGAPGGTIRGEVDERAPDDTQD
jgi:hypothetical protein